MWQRGTEDTDAVNVAQLKALEKKMKNGNSINVAEIVFLEGVYISEETDGSKVIYEKHNGEFYNTNELKKNKIKYDEEKKIFVKEDGSELDKNNQHLFLNSKRHKIKTTEVKLKDNAKLGNINSIDFINNGKTYNFTVINDES